MKRYIVSKELLEAADKMLALLLERDPHDCDVECWTKNYTFAKQCDISPVPDWATEFAGDPHNAGYVESWEFEEIPK